MTRLELRGVARTYEGDVPVHALRATDLVIEQGDYVAIEGPSGSGKSTLLNQIALLDVPTAGTYLVDERDVTDLPDAERARLRSSVFAFIFQSFHLLDGRTVLDNVALGTLYRGLPASRRREKAREALEFVGLAGKAGKKASRLSGGERQRVAIARAIACGAPVVVADEPTGNLDQATGEQVMQTLERLVAAGTTLIIVTHDPSLAARAHRRLHVLDGVVTEAPTPQPEPASERAGRSGLGEMEGRASRVRLLDGLADAWKGLWTRTSRTLALVLSVALGVGLALATAGLSATAQAQVSDIFDAQRNQRVGLTSPSFEDGVPGDVLEPVSRERLGALAGVDDAMVLVSHQDSQLSPAPPGSAGDPSRSGAAPGRPLLGLVGDELPLGILSLDPQGGAVTELGEGEVLLGASAAADASLGPLMASPVVWVDGVPYHVAGVVTDAGLQLNVLNSIIMREPEAARHQPATWASAELHVASGAAPQVAAQAPLAWVPSDPGSVSVDAPPDPTGLRDEIESNLRTMLLTLTGVCLFASVVSLTNAMTTAVFQRVGEFGLRRAIGARRLHVTVLVMVESVVVGLLGGIVGAYGAVLGVLGVTLARHWQPVLDPALIPLGLAGGIVVGLAGGVLATWRAARIEPADALRS